MSSPKAASMAVKLGYKNVYCFKDGLSFWVMKRYPTKSIEKLPEAKVVEVTTADLKGMLDKNEDFILLDVRTENAVQECCVNSRRCICIPLDMMAERYKEIPKDKKVIVIAETGHSAHIAGRYLKTKGYSDIMRVKGGVKRWVKDGYPTENKLTVSKKEKRVSSNNLKK